MAEYAARETHNSPAAPQPCAFTTSGPSCPGCSAGWAFSFLPSSHRLVWPPLLCAQEL